MTGEKHPFHEWIQLEQPRLHQHAPERQHVQQPRRGLLAERRRDGGAVRRGALGVAARVAAEDALEDDYACIRYQGAYTQELIDETDYPSFDIDAANEAFFQWKKHKKQNIMTFRDNGYVSPMTGTMAPAHHTPWKDALDDSLESYMQTES